MGLFRHKSTGETRIVEEGLNTARTMLAKGWARVPEPEPPTAPQKKGGRPTKQR